MGTESSGLMGMTAEMWPANPASGHEQFLLTLTVCLPLFTGKPLHKIALSFKQRVRVDCFELREDGSDFSIAILTVSKMPISRGNSRWDHPMAIITAAAFAAYLKCSIKGLLIARGEGSQGTFFTNSGRTAALAYKTKLKDLSLVSFADLGSRSLTRFSTIFVDAETAVYKNDPPPKDLYNSPKLAREYVPVLCSIWEKLEQSDNLIVAFCALAIGQRTGAIVPAVGKVVFGAAECVRFVKIAELIPKTQEIIDAIGQADDGDKVYRVVLNKHCPSCDFQSRCHRIAKDQDDLSLLSAMSVKERAKCVEKGITTITQLSYGYRPRRRKRASQTTERTKLHLRHDHKLKALAIKKARSM